MTPKLLLFLGSLSGFLSVALGAFGAHALKERLDAYYLGVFKTGVEYQFFHSLALILVGLIFSRALEVTLLRWVGGLFVVGILIFSGSLYLLALTQVKWWGAVTPIGGVCFLAGWLLLCLSVSKLSQF